MITIQLANKIYNLAESKKSKVTFDDISYEYEAYFPIKLYGSFDYILTNFNRLEFHFTYSRGGFRFYTTKVGDKAINEIDLESFCKSYLI